MSRSRRGRSSHNLTSHTARELREFVRKRDGDRCCYCKDVMIFDIRFCNDRKYATLEHICQSLGEIPSNLKLACALCNNNVTNLWPLKKKLAVLGMTYRQCQGL